MVERMVRRAINDLLERMTSDHVGIMDEDRPEVHEDKQAQVELPVQWEEEDEQMVGHGLGEAVKWVERMRREGSGNYRVWLRQ